MASSEKLKEALDACKSAASAIEECIAEYGDEENAEGDSTPLPKTAMAKSSNEDGGRYGSSKPKVQKAKGMF